MSAALLEAVGVGRAFAGRAAVRDVSFSIGSGECLALFGPNGAGKTTLLRLCGALLRPTSGMVSLSGVALPGPPVTRAGIGIISHATMLYDTLTAHENVAFAARLHGVRDPERAADQALERIGASAYAGRRVRSLSRGMQQRVSVARAIVHSPRVLLADEPFTGLDASGAASLAAMLTELKADGAALVLVTHNLDEALALCTHAAIMRDGTFVRYDRAPVPARDEYLALYREVAVNAA